MTLWAMAFVYLGVVALLLLFIYGVGEAQEAAR